MAAVKVYFHVPRDGISRVVLHSHEGRALPLRSAEIFPGPRGEAGAPLPFDEGDVLFRPRDVRLIVKHGRALVINERAGTWELLTGEELALYRWMQKPLPYGVLLYNQHLDVEETSRLVARLAASDLLRVEGSLPLHRLPAGPVRSEEIEVLEKAGCLPEWTEKTIVARSPNLHVIERRGRTLIVDPASASWCVLPEAVARILGSLDEPLAGSQLHERFPHIPPEELVATVRGFFEHGMVTLGGRAFFPPEEELFAPLDDAPLYPRSFYLHATDACNFRCSYCYAKAGGRGKSMTAGTAKRIIDRVLDEMPDESLFIEFHGGEALLRRAMVIEATLYGLEQARKKGKNLGFSLQTNGSLLDDEFVRFAVHTGMKVGISLDGPAEVHDRNRIFPGGAGTHASVWEAFTRAEKLGLQCGFIAVAHEPDDYARAFEFFVSRGIFSFKINYAASLGRAKQLKKTDRSPEAMARGFLEMVERALEFNRKSPAKVKIQDLDFYLRALLTKKREYMCLRSPCGAGRSILAFGTTGEIYPCEEMSTYPEFRCGHLDDETPLPEMIDASPAVARLRARTVRAIPKCMACPWRNCCAGKCLHKAYHAFGDVMREDPMCAFFSTVYEALAWRLDEDPALRGMM